MLFELGFTSDFVLWDQVCIGFHVLGLVFVFDFMFMERSLTWVWYQIWYFWIGFCIGFDVLVLGSVFDSTDMA